MRSYLKDRVKDVLMNPTDYEAWKSFEQIQELCLNI